jgi:hypothetical protein
MRWMSSADCNARLKCGSREEQACALCEVKDGHSVAHRREDRAAIWCKEEIARPINGTAEVGELLGELEDSGAPTQHLEGQLH